jgi:hypothetical protein
VKRLLSAALLLVLACPPAWGAKITIPAEVKVPAGDWYVLQPETDCVGITYVGLDSLKPLPAAVVKDPRWMVINAPAAAGRWRFAAVGCLKDEQVRADFEVVVGDVPPVPPGPTPPGPVPPGPGPVTGMRVLVVYETADLGKMPAAQQSVLYAKPVRDYLDAHTPLGADGKTHAWRFWDANVDPKGDEKVWADLLARPHATTPWVVIADKDGKPAFEGPLPGTITDTLTLLKKYGG